MFLLGQPKDSSFEYKHDIFREVINVWKSERLGFPFVQ